MKCLPQRSRVLISYSPCTATSPERCSQEAAALASSRGKGSAQNHGCPFPQAWLYLWGGGSYGVGYPDSPIRRLPGPRFVVTKRNLSGIKDGDGSKKLVCWWPCTLFSLKVWDKNSSCWAESIRKKPTAWRKGIKYMWNRIYVSIWWL